MSQIAVEFLNRCFTSDETIALLLRKGDPPFVVQRVVRTEQVLEPDFQAWLCDENRTGSNIYVSANPLRSGSRRRTKQSVVSIRHLYIDIDADGEGRLAGLLASDLVPIPSAILSTSPRKYQVLWRVAEFEFDRQEQELKLLAMTFGGDPACTDRNRMLRLPGFLNWKYDPEHLVAVRYPDASIHTPADFRLDDGTANSAHLNRLAPRRKQSTNQSNSELDWAWVSNELALGKHAAKLTRELASRRSDKPNPHYYAPRTVDMASARLWLFEGICFDDVVTMLENRRRSELPAGPCSARAQEIAATAERMLARR
jgi:hypothetical protein